jgi:hypothetical protein
METAPARSLPCLLGAGVVHAAAPPSNWLTPRSMRHRPMGAPMRGAHDAQAAAATRNGRDPVRGRRGRDVERRARANDPAALFTLQRARHTPSTPAVRKAAHAAPGDDAVVAGIPCAARQARGSSVCSGVAQTFRSQQGCNLRGFASIPASFCPACASGGGNRSTPRPRAFGSWPETSRSLIAIGACREYKRFIILWAHRHASDHASHRSRRER